MKKAALHNLGCKVNAYETEAMQQLLEEAGYEIVPFGGPADVYVVNTCSVTNIADRKSRQMLHRARRNNPGAVIVAAGCYVQAEDTNVLEEGIADIVLGNNKKEHLIPMLTQYMNTQMPAKDWESLNGQADYETLSISRTSQHTRAFMKIQDGCNQFCSYCVIPYARGRVRSRFREDVLREVRGMAAAGYREVVLTGIHISSYGIDQVREGQTPSEDYGGRSRLIELVEEIQKVEGLERIRLGSLEPRIVTEDFAARLAACDKVCPHFHLSLQSGCDATLKRMNRHYTAGEYLQSVERLRRTFTYPAITTDVIVGFPGETEEDFEVCRRFLEQAGLYEMHIFKYSRRRGTVADRLPDQLTDAVKTRRSALLQQLEKEQSRAFRSRYIGREAEVLFEETRELGGSLCQVGYTRDYVRVALPGAQPLQGSLGLVRISGFLTEEVMLAQPLQL